MNLRQTEPESQLHKVVRHSKNISLYIAGDLKETRSVEFIQQSFRALRNSIQVEDWLPVQRFHSALIALPADLKKNTMRRNVQKTKERLLVKTFEFNIPSY